MADIEENNPTPELPPLEEKEKTSILKNKFIVIGLPLFIVQLIAVYFITANILLTRMDENKQHGAAKPDSTKKVESAVQTSETGKFIFSIEDIIINPAGTDGKRLLLTSLGFDINSEEDKTMLQIKDVIVKDAVITSLSSVPLDKLNDFSYRDTLKMTLSYKMKQMIPAVKINRIYFSKFILQ